VAFSVLPSHSPSGILIPFAGDRERDHVRAVLQLDPVDHQHRQAHVVEPAAHQRVEVLARARDELAADRRLRRRARIVLERLADRLLRARVAARRDAGEHPLEHHPGERVAVGEVRVGPKRHLTGRIRGSRPRPLDRDAAAAERHRAGLVSVADRDALAVVPALRPHDLIDFLFDQLGQDAEPDADRQREQPLLRGTGQLAERLCHPRRQLRHARAGRRGRDLINQYLLHGGSSSLEWTSIAANAPNGNGRGGRTAASSSTSYGTTSTNPAH
jgi:hypothetical protein